MQATTLIENGKTIRIGKSALVCALLGDRKMSLGLAAVAALTASPAFAAPLYWGSGGTTSNWATATNWYTDAGETTVSAAAPTSSDDVFFNTTPDNALGGQVTVGASNVAANSLTFNTSVATSLIQSGNPELTLGSGGITTNAGAVTLGGSTGSLFVRIKESQTWTNNSTNALSVRRPHASNAASGPVTLTLSATSTGTIVFALAAENSPDTLKTLALVVDSSGTGATSIQGGTYTGGTTVKRGTMSVRAQANGFGLGTVQLGDSSNSFNTTLVFSNNSGTISGGNLIIQPGAGTRTISVVNTGNVVGIDSNILLNKTVIASIGSATAKLQINGAISGTGGITMVGNSAAANLDLRGNNTYTGDTFLDQGTFNLSNVLTNTISTGSLLFDVKDAGSNRVFGDISNAAAIFDGTFKIDVSTLTGPGSWSLVDVATLNESFGDNFLVVNNAGLEPFTQTNNVWTSSDGMMTFTEATGVLTVVPEPTMLAALSLAGGLLLRRRR